jgi:hypothetical protein
MTARFKKFAQDFSKLCSDAWNESDHPREGGKFSSGSKGSPKSKGLKPTGLPNSYGASKRKNEELRQRVNSEKRNPMNSKFTHS